MVFLRSKIEVTELEKKYGTQWKPSTDSLETNFYDMAMKENSLPKMELQAKERQYKQMRPDNMVSGLSEARKQVKADRRDRLWNISEEESNGTSILRPTP